MLTSTFSIQPRKFLNEEYPKWSHRKVYRLSLNTHFFNTSAAIATVVFTELVIIPTKLLDKLQLLSIKFSNTSIDIEQIRTIPYQVYVLHLLKLIQHPHLQECRVGSSPAKPLTVTAVGIWLTSTATPGVTERYHITPKSEPAGNCNFNNKDNVTNSACRT